MTTRPDVIVASSGDVFTDLGFSPEQAANLRLRSGLAIKLCAEIESRGFTQARAAVLFGVNQPRVSDLVRGKLHLFSLDALVNMAARGGLDLRISETWTRDDSSIIEEVVRNVVASDPAASWIGETPGAEVQFAKTTAVYEADSLVAVAA